MAVRKDFGLTYRDKDNSNKTPLCIHRAPLGTHERFIGFLIEHYAGNFPLWLAPETGAQARSPRLEDFWKVEESRAIKPVEAATALAYPAAACVR